jgi:hypothetical protein
MSVVNSDENKTFGAVFRTPVSDSTGIPHILEHSVLCGSRCVSRQWVNIQAMCIHPVCIQHTFLGWGGAQHAQ